MVSDVSPDVSDRLGIDTRALGAFRVAAATVILLDLLIRSTQTGAFYTDGGVLPRTLHAELFPVLHRLSVHTVSGTALAQYVLFASAGIATVAMLLGYRTTLATVITAVFLVSLQVRNPLVLTAGDLTLSILLVFGVFLPLGDRYSLDAVETGGRQTHVATSKTAAPLLFLVVFVYGTNALTRLQSEQWMRGEAVETVFALDSVTVLLGGVLASHPVVLAVINWFWVGLLLAAPVLVLSSGRFRSALALTFIGAHLGIFLTLYLVTFPLANCAGLVLFLPGEFWDRLEDSVPAWFSRAVTDRSQPLADRLYHGSEPPLGGRFGLVRRRFGSLAVVAILLSLAVWATLTLGNQRDPADETTALSVDQPYALTVFSPEPLQTDGWYVAPATLESGLVVDALELDSVNWDRPPDSSRVHHGPRWTTYLVAGHYRVHVADDAIVTGFARYLCRRSADHYTPDVETVSVYFVEDRPGRDTTRRRLTEHTCQ